MNESRLSQDIMNVIMENLEGEPSALQLCALVSWSFRPTAQRLLFSSIDLDVSYMSINKLDRLAAVKDISPHLFDHVKDLKLSLGLMRDPKSAIDILQSLPNLSSLSLTPSKSSYVGIVFNVWKMLSLRIQKAVIDCIQKPSLRRATIRISGFPLPIIAALPYLRQLNVELCNSEETLRDIRYITPNPCQSPGYLESLSHNTNWLGDSDLSTPALIRLLAEPTSLLRLTRLKQFNAFVSSPRDCDLVQQVVDVTGNSLQELILINKSLQCWSALTKLNWSLCNPKILLDNPGFPSINMKTLVQLKKIELVTHEDVGTPRWILDSLMTLPDPNNLKDISFTALHTNEYENPVWQDIDSLLSTDLRFPGLRKVMLQYISTDPYQSLEKKFPGCAMSGSLVVYHAGKQVFPAPTQAVASQV